MNQIFFEDKMSNIVSITETDEDDREMKTEQEINYITEIRAFGKILNFGLLFGMKERTFQGYAENSGVILTIEEATEYRKKYFELYPEILEYQSKQRLLLREPIIKTYTAIGRRRIYDNPKDAYNAVVNSPIQGTDGDMFKLARRRNYEFTQSHY